MLISEICDLLAPAAANRAAADVRVALRHTAARSADECYGLAWNLRDGIQQGRCVIKFAGTLPGWPVSGPVE